MGTAIKRKPIPSKRDMPPTNSASPASSARGAKKSIFFDLSRIPKIQLPYFLHRNIHLMMEGFQFRRLNPACSYTIFSALFSTHQRNPL